MRGNHSAAVAFLACRRIAVVGVSRDRRGFSRSLAEELARRGYDVVPVNPLGGDPVAGVRCVRRVQDITPPPEAALLLTAPEATEQVVRDCAASGVRRVWMHRGMGPGAASPAAIAYCRDAGMELVTDACPFMYLTGASFVHRAHRWSRQNLVAMIPFPRV
jgi:predicted CoA-binding protein